MHKIASRLAGYDFRTKMEINALVLKELGRVIGKDSDLNVVAEAIADSPIHLLIQQLADAIDEEANKIKTHKDVA